MPFVKREREKNGNALHMNPCIGCSWMDQLFGVGGGGGDESWMCLFKFVFVKNLFQNAFSVCKLNYGGIGPNDDL